MICSTNFVHGLTFLGLQKLPSRRLINKLIGVQFGKSCAEFWAKYPFNTPIQPHNVSDWKKGFKKHGKFKKPGREKNDYLKLIKSKTDYQNQKIDEVIEFYLKHGDDGKRISAQYISDQLMERFEIKLSSSSVKGKVQNCYILVYGS